MPRRLDVVQMAAPKKPIIEAPGFWKKRLADRHLETAGLCGFSCSYCSTNAGNTLRINRLPFAQETERQTGKRIAPVDVYVDGELAYAASPDLTFSWPDVEENLIRQIFNDRGNASWGKGETLIVSQLTDAFAGPALQNGVTERILLALLKHTSFRIRILTKNSTVGLSKFWRGFFREWSHRVVVGLSCGTLDPVWARAVEIGTPPPGARLGALRALQDAAVPTFGMACPIFPDVLAGDGLERLFDQMRPHRCETIWFEGYNDRANWEAVRKGYPVGSFGWEWLTRVFEKGDRATWSAYVRELHERVMAKARREGWASKVIHLLYEGDVTAKDAPAFVNSHGDFEGVLLQGTCATIPGPMKAGRDGVEKATKIETGWSVNPAFRALQKHEGHGYRKKKFPSPAAPVGPLFEVA